MIKSSGLVLVGRIGAAAASLVALAALGGSGCDPQHMYVVGISVSGSTQAVQGRSVKAGKTDMPPFAADASTFIELCTPSADKFFKTAIPMVVSDATGIVSTSTLTPVACGFAQPRGSNERDFVFLQDDGTLLTDFTAGDARVHAQCNPFAAGTDLPARRRPLA